MGFIRVPYYIGDLKRDPDLENYPDQVFQLPWPGLRAGMRKVRSADLL